MHSLTEFTCNTWAMIKFDLKESEQDQVTDTTFAFPTMTKMFTVKKA